MTDSGIWQKVLQFWGDLIVILLTDSRQTKELQLGEGKIYYLLTDSSELQLCEGKIYNLLTDSSSKHKNYK